MAGRGRKMGNAVCIRCRKEHGKVCPKVMSDRQRIKLGLRRTRAKIEAAQRQLAMWRQAEVG